MLKALLDRLAEQMGAIAVGRVWSGTKEKWYANPLGKVYRLFLLLAFLGLLGLSHLYRLFYYCIVPALIVCMFITIHRMNDKLDTITAAQDSKTAEAVTLEWLKEIADIEIKITIPDEDN